MTAALGYRQNLLARPTLAVTSGERLNFFDPSTAVTVDVR